MGKKNKMFWLLIGFFVVSFTGDPAAEADTVYGPGTLKSWIDKGPVQHCATFTVPPGTSFRLFEKRQLEAGYNAHTGVREQIRSFQIMKNDSGETVYRFFHKIGEKPVEKPVPLKELCLPHGSYRLCVAGGVDAICILAYQSSPYACPQSQTPQVEKQYIWVKVCKVSGDLPNERCPLLVKRKFKKGKEPRKVCTIHGPMDLKEVQRVRDEMKIADLVDEILKKLKELNKMLDDFDSKIKYIQNLKEAQQAQARLNQFRSHLNQLKDDQRRVRYFAESRGIDIGEAGSGDEWSQSTLNLNWTDHRIDRLESDVNDLKKTFTEEGLKIRRAASQIPRQLDILEESSRVLERAVKAIRSLQASRSARNRLSQIIRDLRRVQEEMKQIKGLARKYELNLKVLLGRDYENIAQKWETIKNRLLGIKKRLDELDKQLSGIDQTILKAIDIFFSHCTRIARELTELRSSISTVNSLAGTQASRQRLNTLQNRVTKIKDGFSRTQSAAQQKGINLVKLLGKRYGELKQNLLNLDNQIKTISRHLDMLETALNRQKTVTPPPSHGVIIPENCTIEGQYWFPDEPADKSPFRFALKAGRVISSNFTNIRNLRSNCSLAGNTIRCIYTWEANRLEISLIFLEGNKLSGRYNWRGSIKQLTGRWKMSQLTDQSSNQRSRQPESRENINRTPPPVKPDPEEARILSEYCKLWPKFLRQVSHPGCKVTVISCGTKSGDYYIFKYKYRCKSGFQWNEYNPQPSRATLADLKKLLRSMKERLGEN